MAKELSAKDKAFQEEKMKLRRQADMWRSAYTLEQQRVTELEKQINQLNATINTLTKEIESHFNMSVEEFAAHVSREKKANQALEMLFSLRGTY